MARASDAACNEWAAKSWGFGEDLTQIWPAKPHVYHLRGDPGNGKIHSRLELVNGYGKECKGPMKMDFYLCSRAMRRIIDRW